MKQISTVVKKLNAKNVQGCDDLIEEDTNLRKELRGLGSWGVAIYNYGTIDTSSLFHFTNDL